MAAIGINVHKNSYLGAVAITPDNSNDLADPVSALYIGGAGALKVDMINGDTVTFAAVPVGVFKIAVKRVYATGTVATNIIGLK